MTSDTILVTRRVRLQYIVKLVKARGGSDPKVQFLDSCAEFYGLSGEAIENPHFSVF